MAPGRPGRDLTPEVSAAHRLGAELRRWRAERGLTQGQLGELLHHSAALIGKIEKADRRASRDLCRRADEALATGGRLTRLWLAAAQQTAREDLLNLDRRPDNSERAAVEATVPELRRVLDRLDLPDDGPTRPSDALAAAVAAATEHRLQGSYLELAANLPNLIEELARATHLHRGEQQRYSFRMLTSALRAADAVAFKFGYHDLSGRLIDVMRACCPAAEDPALDAAVAYVRTESFFVSGDLDTAARALALAADDLTASHPRRRASAAQVAALGALHMRAAVVSARAGNREAAIEHVGLTRLAAHRVDEGVYRGTAFGPASLRIHELAVAAELGDPAGVERAATWDPPATLPAERRSHYHIELARAQAQLGHDEQAHSSLRAARLAAPVHTRNHPQVWATISALTAQGASTTELRDLVEWIRAG